ncbi:MAG: YciK family oxidoreductase [Gammaproteobacteria bacterium]|jgi:NAD(P)-dependent dehydrogenase (short-subunit alcohol dehydrogenase family)|nr:YciK family oxidoreductase [Gammaproteobacteria bacterium]|tara:strand:+ start:231 stop:974 length:744 start_codon:yes stop_codon:yes gene_type:complete
MKHVPKLETKKNLLADKNILITGAGSGIGRAVAKASAQHGANLILLSKDIKKLYSLQDEICTAGLKDPLVVELDFFKAKEKDYKTLAENLYDQYEKLDGLAHIAGILGYLSPMINTSLSQLKTVMQVNFESNFLLTQLALPLIMQAKNPSIIFTSSGVGRKARAFWTSYSISKFAVEGLMQSLADEYEKDMRVNSYNPGPTRTNMRAQAFPAEDPNSLRTPEMIADDYLWLLSDECKETGVMYNFHE